MRYLPLIFFASIVLSGCATSSGGTTSGDYVIDDDYESFNRASYRLTDRVDRAILLPVANGYKAITPDFLERGVANFFANLRTLPSAMNGFLQGKPASGGEDMGRFLVNSTLGVGGLFDIGSRVGLEAQNEDLGQTFAVWGWERSRFIFIPFLGPTTWRDLPGALLGSYTPRWMLGDSYHWGISVLDVVSGRAEIINLTDTRDSSAFDPYTFVRDGYAQRRRFLIYDGDLPMDDLFDDFDDFEEEDVDESGDVDASNTE